MEHPHHIRRFRANPVEVAVFSVLILIFFNSIYHLFYNHGGFSPTALVPMNANPISEGRSIASTQQNLQVLELDCAKEVTKEISANKVRISSKLCSQNSSETLEPEMETPRVQKATIVNKTIEGTIHTATVFPDHSRSKYSTDYITLGAGLNSIQVEIVYENGKSFSQLVKLTKL